MAVIDSVSLGTILALDFAFIMFLIALVVAIYVYISLTLVFIAKKTKTEPSWLAWIPIANLFLMAKIAKMDWWPILLLMGVFIPVFGGFFGIVFLVFMIVWTWKICENLSKPGWWSMLVFIPVAGWVCIWGILAWKKKSVKAVSVNTVKAEPIVAPVKNAVVKKTTIKKVAKKKR